MNTTKKGLVAAAALVIVGLLVFMCIMIMNKWNFKALNTGKLETKTYDFAGAFDCITISSDINKIELIPSDNDMCKVEIYEYEHMKHSVDIIDGTLTIKSEDKRKWYESFGIDFSNPYIKVYLPGTQYETLSVKSDTGNIKVPDKFMFRNTDISASTANVFYYAVTTEKLNIETTTGKTDIKDITVGELKIEASTGNITVSNVTCNGKASTNVSTGTTTINGLKCKEYTSSGSTGSLRVNDLFAEESIKIDRDTGSVVLEGVKAGTANIETSTESVSGRFLEEMTYIASSSTGKIDVPEGTRGGKVRIETSTGSISFE